MPRTRLQSPPVASSVKGVTHDRCQRQRGSRCQRLARYRRSLIASSPSVDVLGGTSHAASWPYPNGNLANTRVAVRLVDHDGRTCHALKEVWSFKLSGKAKKSIQELGSLAMTPIVVDNVVYIQDLS